MTQIKDQGVLRETNCTEELFAIRDSLEILGGKWKLLILIYLKNRQDRLVHFKMIERGIEGISAKMLSKELKELEVNLLVTRTIQNTRPITVTYALTDYGKSVIPVIDALVQWGFDHRTMIKQAR
ncbi:winged helix-turn-helix transcriptional regulator [Flavobacterium cerinum]|uniref:Helix-turn-helix transcriptional regulator n=1 Tax=Flavobacterium cerinum TaxID=2502784 RepID=A0ABY5IPN4_9FLAO|nr:helix-turn-helix domain-containing protein [Flavobacterium cerinum]UUC44791.1 helix-turn-helix transcriptional regulator [Flavobacterium cerinum]